MQRCFPTLLVFVAKLLYGLDWLFRIMAARTIAQIAEALATMAEIMARDNQPGREDETRLKRFMKHKPPTFTGGYNPEGAVNWLEEVEIIFEAMGCSEE
ncbi:hypothetical protein A2U01_0066446, partial [Trifolium medium]|nr:hypothetical protein [Trifolium medium]